MAAQSLHDLRSAITQYNAKVDARMSKLETRLDNLEDHFTTRLEKLSELVDHCNKALAGASSLLPSWSAYSLDIIRIRELMVDARIVFRFAIISYDPHYKCGLSVLRENVDQWWNLFRDRVLSEEGISQSASPSSIWQFCRDEFHTPLLQLRKWAEEARRAVDEEAKTNAAQARAVLDLDGLMKQMARMNFDVNVLPHQGVDFMRMPEEQRKAEIAILFSQCDRMHAMVTWNTFNISISILEDSNAFQLMEECERSGGAALWEWSNVSAHPTEEHDLTETSLSSGILILPWQTRQSLFSLWNAVNSSFRLTGDRTQVPGGPFGQNDPTSLLSFSV